jgi:hypothetical protein
MVGYFRVSATALRMFYLLCLAFEQDIREIPKFRVIDALNSKSSFMDKRGRRVPRLNLLSEDELHLIGVLVIEIRYNVL